MTQDTQAAEDALPVPVSLELWSPLYEKLAQHEAASAAIRSAIAEQLISLMETLSIPGKPIIRIAAIEPGAQRATYWLRLTVHENLCRYPHALIQRAYSYASDTILLLENSPDAISHWLLNCPLDVAEQRDMVSAFFGFVCAEVIKRQPQVLLSLPQVAAYSASLPLPAEATQLSETKDVRRISREQWLGLPPAKTAPLTSTAWPPDPAWLYPVLCHVLQQKISLAKREIVAAALYAHQDQAIEDASEELIEALRTDVIEIHLSPEYLRQLSTSFGQGENTSFDWLRAELLKDSGLRYPDFHFVPAPAFRANSFAFKVHDILLLPWKGLSAEQRVANMTTEYVRDTFHLQGTATISPHRWEENTLFSTSDNPALAETSRNALGYLQLCLYAAMKEHAFCFVHSKQVQDQLDGIFPSFKQMITRQHTAGQITSLLRKLLMQGLPVRNLPRILDHLLDYDFLQEHPTSASIIDPALAYSTVLLDLLRSKDPEFIISFIRAEMKRTIGYLYGGDSATLHAFYLDPSIENLVFERLRQSDGQQKETLLHEEESNHLMDALHEQMLLLADKDYTPVILTQIYTRPVLQELVTAEEPRAAVLALQEIPPTLSQIDQIAILTMQNAREESMVYDSNHL